MSRRVNVHVVYLVFDTLRRFTVKSIVSACHVYQRLWEASVSKKLLCQRERGNLGDPSLVYCWRMVMLLGIYYKRSCQFPLPSYETEWYRSLLSLHTGTACYVSLLLWDKPCVLTCPLGQGLGIQAQLSTVFSASLRGAGFNWQFPPLGSKNQYNASRVTKWLQGPSCQTWHSHGMFSNRFYFHLIVGLFELYKNKSVQKLPQTW